MIALPLPDTTRARVVYGLVGATTTILIAELLVRSGILDSDYVPPPSATLAELARLASNPLFWQSVGNTLLGAAAGLAIALLVALPLGYLIGTNSYIYHATRPIIEFLRPVPSVALVPVAVLMLGIGINSKIFLVAFACTWPLLVQTVYGLRAVDPTLLATAQSYRIPAATQIRSIILPAASPYLATGIRISATIAIVLAVTAELVIGSPGIGKDILLAQSNGAFVTLYALVFAAGFLALAVNLLIQRAERAVLRWHPSHRSTAS